jgi:hypothetical protein
MAPELHRARELLVVGIPRSGTTLLSALIDSLEDAVCLSEAKELFIGADATPQAYVDRVTASVREYRSRLIGGGGDPIWDRRNPDGSAITNYFRTTAEGRRVQDWPMAPVPAGPYSENLLLAVKHNMNFLSVLPQLAAGSIPVLSIVRHPIPTILSWRSTNLPIGRGEMAQAERFWPEVNAIMSKARNVYEGWALIFEALCRRILDSGVSVVKYEDIVAGVVRCEDLLGRRAKKTILMQNQNDSPFYDRSLIEQIAHALKACGEAMRVLYPEIDYAV